MAKRKFTTMVFLLTVFLALALSLGFWLYNIYNSSTGYSRSTAEKSIECVDYSFSVIKYEIERDTTILLRNNVYGEKPITELIASDEVRKATIDAELDPGKEKEVVLPFVDDFSLYVPGCERFALDCDSSELQCS